MRLSFPDLWWLAKREGEQGGEGAEEEEVGAGE